ncbi:hypothetical protein KBD20_03600 [Candidatus Saccharibacteria bacterium]|nr:hypothetical protein [Candidatus Saccharibacteria bacterium]
MASRMEVSQIRLPSHIEDGITKVFDAAQANEGGGGARVRSDLRKYMIDTVVDDESVHPVAKASLAASVSTSLVDVKDSAAKYHPITVTQRKLTAMRAFLGSMRSGGIVLLKDNIAARNTENPQLVGTTTVDRESSFPRIESSVAYQFADIVSVRLSEFDPFDMEISRSDLGAKDGVITMDGTQGNPEYILKYLTGLDQYGSEKVKGSMKVGVARDAELYDYIAAVNGEEPAANTSIAYPPNVLRALGASVAVKAVSEGNLLAVPSFTHEELREEFRRELSHIIVSLAMREDHREGVDETRYCCPSHGDVTSFRRRKTQISQWTTEQLAIVLSCLDLSVDDLAPQRKRLDTTSSIGEVVSDVINHEAVDAVMRDLQLRLSTAQ